MSAVPSPLVLAIPVLNAERFLPEAIESLNAQGEAVRWWLQDGGSIDRTVEIARRLARQSDTVVSEPDKGQADALNHSMAKMGGEIIGFINGDDLLTPHAAQRVLTFFAENPKVDLIYGSVEWIDANGTPTGTHTGRMNSLDEGLDIYRVWWKKRQWVQPEVFYRRALWEKIGGFDTSYHLAFDYDFWMRCFLAGACVAHLPVTLARFRRHAGQKSSASKHAADEIRAIVQKHLLRAPISPVRRWLIQSRLSYDLYQSGKSTASRGSFFREMLRHPQWLLSSHARARAYAACLRRFSGDQQRGKNS